MLTSRDTREKRCPAQLPYSSCVGPFRCHLLLSTGLILILPVWMSHSRKKKRKETSLCFEFLLCVRHCPVPFITSV